MPFSACLAQDTRAVLPATPNDGQVVQPGCLHLPLARLGGSDPLCRFNEEDPTVFVESSARCLPITFTMPFSACLAQNSRVVLPTTPYDGQVVQPGCLHPSRARHVGRDTGTEASVWLTLQGV